MRYPDLEIDLLRAFIAVAETGSFTAAADVIGRSQPAVSQKVLRLEEILQRRIFERTSRSLALTRDGEHVLVMARRILEVNDSFMREMLAPPAKGTLRLGVCEDFLPRELPALLARFTRFYPGVHIDLMTGLSCDLLEAYDDNRLDAVITKKARAAPRGRVIWREPLVWMAAADYPLDLAGLDLTGPARLVMLRAPCTYRDVMVEALDAVRHDCVAACTAGSVMAVHAAVAGGLGITVLGRSFAARPGMRVLRAPDHWPALPMTEIAVLGEESKASDLVRPLVCFLTETLAANSALDPAEGGIRLA